MESLLSRSSHHIHLLQILAGALPVWGGSPGKCVRPYHTLYCFFPAEHLQHGTETYDSIDRRSLAILTRALDQYVKMEPGFLARVSYST